MSNWTRDWLGGGGIAGSGPQTFTGQVTFSGPSIIQSHTVVTASNAYTVSPSTARSFAITLTQNITITLGTAPTANQVQYIDLDLIQDTGGGFTVTWANITWASGVAPTIASTAGAKTKISIIGTPTSGWVGFYLAQPTDTLTAGGITINGVTYMNGATRRFVREFTGTAAAVIDVSAGDNILVVNKGTGGATKVHLPVGVLGHYISIKDGKGDAASNNITVSAGQGIDSSATSLINTNWDAKDFVFNGTKWNVI